MSSGSIHVATNDRILLFYGYPLCIYTTFSLSNLLLMDFQLFTILCYPKNVSVNYFAQVPIPLLARLLGHSLCCI
jgi:hypothetical protein